MLAEEAKFAGVRTPVNVVVCNATTHMLWQMHLNSYPIFPFTAIYSGHILRCMCPSM